MADNGRQQQLEFTTYQEELQATHNRLAQSSSAILATQVLSHLVYKSSLI